MTTTVITRAGKGSRLTNTEVDTNFTDLTTDAAREVSTFASLPSATGRGGQLRRVSNIGPSGYGSLWCCTGARWSPLNGRCNLAMATPQSGIGTSETLVLQALIPAGVLKANDLLRLFYSVTKSGTTDTCTHRVRVGTAGTTADTQIWTGTILTAAQQSGAFISEIAVVSATSLQRTGQGALTVGSYSIANATATPAAVAISSADSNPLYVSLFLLSSGATNTVGLNAGQIELITP